MEILKDSNWRKLREGKKCVLIGNAPKINNYGLGEKIDQFDFVVRLNNAPTDNYEKKVGSKTDLRVINKPIQEEKEIGNSGKRDGILEDFESNILLYPTREEIENEAEEKLTNAKKVYKISEDFRDYKEALSNKLNIKRISTGLFSTVFLIHIYESVTLVNFDFYNSTDGSYHYWEDFDGGDTSSHDFEKEEEFIETLLRRGFIYYVHM